jgi:hypothetical protein
LSQTVRHHRLLPRHKHHRLLPRHKHHRLLPRHKHHRLSQTVRHHRLLPRHKHHRLSQTVRQVPLLQYHHLILLLAHIILDHLVDRLLVHYKVQPVGQIVHQ